MATATANPDARAVIIGTGGESEGPDVVTLLDIAQDIEQAQYSGFRAWEVFQAVTGTGCAHLTLEQLVVAPIHIERCGLTEHDDIATGTYRAVLTGWGCTVELGTFTVRTDLRA